MANEVINAKTNYTNIQKLYGMIENLTEKIGKRCIDEATILESVTKEWLKTDIGVTAQEAMDNMNNAIGGWNTLDKTTPLDVLINMKKYQIQIKSSCEGWRDTDIKDEVALFEKINNQFLKYRYRIQEKKEPIQCNMCNGKGKIILCYDKFSHSSLICGKCSGLGIID